MAKIGIIGLGMMGTTHLDAYQKTAGAEVVAIADKSPALLSGEATASGNIEGQAAAGVASLGEGVARYSDA
ncbi:MAG: gfo/Idh/MocA family oxidoreductase, partial [Phycisphaerales bacterium]|nr:gfo/Idh/MocA family oxidoreductase [Phycisphaerales bacterium]